MPEHMDGKMNTDLTEPTQQPLNLKASGPRLSNGRWSAEPAECPVSRPLSLLASEPLSLQPSEPIASWPLAEQHKGSAPHKPLSLQASMPLSHHASKLKAQYTTSR